MLLLAVFVVVPVSDALACSIEPHSAGSTPHSASSDEDQGARPDHEIPAAGCSHGHCHHSNASLPLQVPAPSTLLTASVWSEFSGSDAYSVTLDGLSRPPQR